MKRVRPYIPLVLQFVATLLLLGVVCVQSPELPSGEVAKQWWWLGRMGVLYAVCIWISLLFCFPNSDGKGDYSLIVTWTLLLLGGIEATIGLCQLYGLVYSNHVLFELTGTFFNPGPYSGYLAMVFPLALHEHYRLEKVRAASRIAQIGYFLSTLILLLILCVLPVGMSRSAWLAASISGLFVVWYHKDWGTKWKNQWRKNRRKRMVYSAAFVLLLLVGLTAAFNLKKDSANGRLFMWKISLKAIAERPLTGYGAGGFPAAYGAAQETYFSNGDYAEWEEYVAGSPEYAFNEYLQTAIEWGLLALLVCLIVVVLCIWQGIKHKRIGLCAGLVSLAVFAFSSYPLQLPLFQVSFLVLLFACVVPKKQTWGMALFALAIALSSVWLWKNNHYEASKKWIKPRMLYHAGAYELARKEYALLYPQLKRKAGFMFEYGRCLHQLEDYDASITILQETARLTCDPMVLNVMGKNFQAKGDYPMVETCFLRSTHLLPGRIYPYYLLAKLYAEPDYLHPDKLEHAAQVVLTKEPKVQSTAVREMREEIMALLSTVHANP